MKKLPYPPDLGDRGKRLWDYITATYELSVMELEQVAEIASMADDLASLRAALRAQGADLLITGSVGQIVVSPLVKESREHRLVFDKLITSLKMPDPRDENGRLPTEDPPPPPTRLPKRRAQSA
jgi:hypothetical protein